MRVFRILAAIAAMFVTFSAAPASAQFFLKPVDLSGPKVTGAEPGMVGQALPGATPAELRAALVWNLRAALNVAALQCQFEPTLITINQYNTLLSDHSQELKSAYETLSAYFQRMEKTKKAAQLALDQYGTRVYSGFSTVGGQLSFCQTANDIGSEVLFAKQQTLGDIAQARMYELRRSLLSWGDQQFRNRFGWEVPDLVNFSRPECWDEGVYRPRKCGIYPVGRYLG
ncbi:hypothetical protein [Stakelama saccharophila]|uniref:Uncharacterized protein n=1 Tax=Stakelama saccharophila TaxID=3075605 RepID=A0ABZ0B7F5_9SPHN|nr:hypothetical protein [Stakelama sp. W311]WNO53224.1 hypothetical protein RPR59_12335 [Stakelama sp. W311]